MASSLVIKSAERQRSDKMRQAQFRLGAVFRKAAAAAGGRKKQQQRAGGDKDARIIQDPAVFVRALEGELTRDRASDAAFAFVSNRVDEGAAAAVADEAVPAPKTARKKAADEARRVRNLTYTEGLGNLNLASALNADMVATLFKETYVLDPVPFVPTSSLMAPVLRWASTKDANVKVFIDATKRLVVKMYPLDTIIDAFIPKDASEEAEDARDMAPLVDLVADIVISHSLTALVLDYERVVTPHFAFPVDWFIGPKIDGDGIKYERDPVTQKIARLTDIKTRPGTLAQYIVVERADLTLGDVMRAASVSVRAMRALLWQIFFSLEAAWLLRGFLHYDTHMDNFMVRNLLAELDSPYLHRTWAYKRAGANALTYLTLADHGHMFVEIIDTGRSRAFVTLDDDPARALRLVGNPMLDDLGIHVGGGTGAAAAKLDRSWDMRRLGLDLLINLDIAAMLAERTRGFDGKPVALAPTDTDMADQFKDLIGYMLGGAKFVAAINAVGKTWTPDLDDDDDDGARRPTKAVRAQQAADAQARTLLWDQLKAAGAKLAAKGAPPPSNADIYTVFAAAVAVVRASPLYYDNLFFDALIRPVFFRHMVAPKTAKLYRDDTLHVTSCIEHAFFDGISGQALTAEQRDAARQAALVVGFVTQSDVLADSSAGVRKPRNDATVSVDADDDDDKDSAPAAEVVRRGRPPRRAANGGAAAIKCLTCDAPATGYAMPERVPFCGDDCMWVHSVVI